MKRFLFLIPISMAWGSVNESIRWEVETGYRNDNLHWHLKQNEHVILREHLRNLQFWENAFALRAIDRDIALFAKGAYGFGHQGWSADGWGYLGYAVNLTPDRTYKVILIPLAGYGVDVEQLQCRDLLHMCWFGPLFGGLFKIEPGERLQFEAGYVYHRLHLRFKAKIPPDLLKVKDGANLAHTGWGRIDYMLSHEWQIGLAAQIQYFASRILDGTLKNQTTKTTGHFKARWTACSGALTLSRRF